ncbi:MAG: alpha/beta fold hydrolase [Fimbriimonadaceae bacterium]|nr:alpha/beta fold hydrolase [Fimbriimonadaceae bacterium]
MRKDNGLTMVWILGILGFYLLVLLAISWISVHPFRTPVYFGPGSLGVPQEDVFFTTSDGITLKGWWSEPDNPVAIVILSHGYIMNRSELSPLAIQLFNQGCACLTYDFRGHGRSGKGLCGCGVYEVEDVRSAVEFAKSKHPDLPVVLIGSSMGAVASALAVAKYPHLSSIVVLDSAYSRLPSAILGWWRFVGGRFLQTLLAPTVFLPSLFIRVNPFKVDVAQAIKDASHAEFLLLHGDRDTLALPGEAVRNKEAAPDRCRLVWLPGCGHSEGRWEHPTLYESSLSCFLLDNDVQIRHNHRVGVE